jgi:hypothetical protein
VISLQPKPKRKKRGLSKEDVLSSHFFKWLFYTHKELFEVAHHVANEGKRKPHMAKILGIKAGIPDIFIPHPYHIYHGLYIELKIHPNEPTDSQLAMIEKLRKRRYMCRVCYTLDETMDAVNDYLLSGG